MKIAIYSPYLDTAGGGEKYILTIAQTLATQAEVEVLLDSHLVDFGVDYLKSKNETAHGLDLSKVNFVRAPVDKSSNKIKRFNFLKKYDLLFFNSDGSIFFSGAKRSIVHFQMPFDDLGIQGLVGKIKLKSWNEAVYNSLFTKNYIEKTWPLPGRVIYPPVDVEEIKPLPKKKIILSVGRFVKATKVKKHDEIINAFKVLSPKLPGWSLHLAGGLEKGDESYLNDLKTQANNFDIHFYPNITREKLHRLYGEASVYWHFMGYKEADPKRSEHFGISTVEAMAGGGVPVVINKGGQVEIVENGKNGYLWDDLEELYKFTLELSASHKLLEGFSKKARDKAKDFSLSRFEEEIKELVYG